MSGSLPLSVICRPACRALNAARMLQWLTAMWLYALLLTAALVCRPCQALTLETGQQTVQIPDSTQLKQIRDNISTNQALTAEEKEGQLASIDECTSLQEQYVSLAKQIQDQQDFTKSAPADLEKIKAEYEKLHPAMKEAPDKAALAALDMDATRMRLDSESNELMALQQQQLTFQNAVNELQTLFEHVNPEVLNNEQSISNLLQEIAHAPDLAAPRILAAAMRVLYLRRQNDLLLLKVSNQVEQQDLAEYRLRIINLKIAHQNAEIAALQDHLSALSAQPLAADAAAQQSADTGVLSGEMRNNAAVAAMVEKNRGIALKLNQYLRDYDNRLTAARQMLDLVSSEVRGMEKGLLLSRLLNHQQMELNALPLSLPDDMNIDTADLSMMIYETRNMRDVMFDLDEAASQIIKLNPALKDYRAELKEVLSARKDLMTELIKELSGLLTAAISIGVKEKELSQLCDTIRSNINENLLWLKSNMSFGKDLLALVIPATVEQYRQAGLRVRGDGYAAACLVTTVLGVLPIALLTLFLRLHRRRIREWDNSLARRIDRPQERWWLTPLACLVCLLQAIPSILPFWCAGAVVAMLDLSESSLQLTVVYRFAAFLVLCAFTLRALRINSLAQRYFCMHPAHVRSLSALLRPCCFTSAPIFLLADIWEVDTTGIFRDIQGYLLILILCLTQFVICTLWLKKHLRLNGGLPVSHWLVLSCCALAPLAILIVVGSGYYLTTMKILAHVPPTMYLMAVYWILVLTLQRTLVLTQQSLLMLSRHQQEEEPLGSQSGQVRHRRMVMVGSGVFTTCRYLLLIGVCWQIYVSWRDVFGALNYLDHFKLWSTTEIINGSQVVIDSLSLGDLLSFCLTMLITVLLARNMPALIEKVLSLSRSKGMHTTGYTAKIISFYLIVAVGMIFAAASLHITWDKLQWLVAALSVGLGFGLQEIFANFVSGIIILFERQLRIGDIITLGSLSGTVSRIRIRSTTVVTFDNKEVLIPNKQFITSSLTNWSLSNTITKIEFAVGVAYDSDITQVKRVLTRILRHCPNLHKQTPPQLFVTDLGASSVNLNCEVYVAEIGKRKATMDYLCTETLRQFAAQGIEIPYNKLDISLKEVPASELREALSGRSQADTDAGAPAPAGA